MSNFDFNNPVVWVVGGIILLALLILFIFTVCYKKCPPNKAMVITGPTGTSTVIGKAKIVIPFIQRVDYMSLENIQVDFTSRDEIPTKDAINILVDAVANMSIDQDPEVLKVGDVTICTLGNFSASIGKAKSKKTFNLSAIVAAALKGDMVVNYTGCFPPDKNKILYVDTEQSDHHCNRVYKRILKLAGLPDDEDCDRLEFLGLRKHTPADRLGIIDAAIHGIDGLGLVIIDGVRDLVVDGIRFISAKKNVNLEISHLVLIN